ncbi:MAG: DUF1211 domain-containing protein [Sphingobacteriaceae bacterium]|nr:MAG: DUF1211 domain-containing protein [Sphingobacteriaceae bacterium]
MNKTRLEAFSDGVIAIIITIMVLELKVPHADDLDAIVALLPVFFSYVLSFVYIGIYWNNHHHMLFAAGKINGKVLWANLHLLFWLSLIPFGTEWMGENHFTKWPAAVYGLLLLMSAAAYSFLAMVLMKQAGKESKLTKAFGKDWKGKVSILLYLLAIFAAFINSKLSLILYGVVAILWFIPDPRIERTLLSHDEN